MHIKFLKVNWELRTWILWRIVCISRNWTNFIKKIYTYNLRSFLFVSLHTAQAQCTLYTVIMLYTVLEHILLRCTTLNSKIYMTTMNNESYCCVLIPLPWKKFDEAPLKIIDEKIKMQYETYCFSALVWWWIVMFFLLGHHSRSHDGSKDFNPQIIFQTVNVDVELPKTDGQGYSYILSIQKFWTKVIKNWWIQYGNFTSSCASVFQ